MPDKLTYWTQMFERLSDEDKKLVDCIEAHHEHLTWAFIGASGCDVPGRARCTDDSWIRRLEDPTVRGIFKKAKEAGIASASEWLASEEEKISIAKAAQAEKEKREQDFWDGLIKPASGSTR